MPSYTIVCIYPAPAVPSSEPRQHVCIPADAAPRDTDVCAYHHSLVPAGLLEVEVASRGEGATIPAGLPQVGGGSGLSGR